MTFTVVKRFFLPTLVLIPFACSSQATDPSWVNSGTINFPPQIDASNVVNSGTIQFNTSLPFESSNTHNYTNSGTIICSPGWLFDDVASNTGLRMPSDNFVNLNGGTISALDAVGVIFGLGPSSSVSYLWVSASNVVSKGTLSVGGSGWLKITGTNVNLARSALEVT